MFEGRISLISGIWELHSFFNADGIQYPFVCTRLTQACGGDGACIEMVAFTGLGLSGSC